jgi:hypothetical protein
MAVAIPIVVAAVTIAAAGVTAYSQVQQGRTANAVATYNAQLANRNAEIAEQNAEAAKLAGTAREEQSRDEVRRVLARQRALVGASGVTTEGSPLLVMMESARQGELDALRIRYTSEVEARSGQFQAQQYQSEATLQRLQGKQAQTAGYMSAGGTLLTGFAQAGTGYYNAKYGNRGAGTPLL